MYVCNLRYSICTQPYVLLKLYIHLVRPHIEFAYQVWSPHQQFLIDTKKFSEELQNVS